MPTEKNREEKEDASIASLNNSQATTIDDSTASKKKKAKEPGVSFVQLFRFATLKERCMIVIAMLFSAGSGALQPISILIYGNAISALTGSLSDPASLVSGTLPIIHTMVYMGTASLIAAYISTCFWVLTGESQTRRIKSLYLKSVLNQDMSWFDQAKDGSLNTRLATDTQVIQDGISEKFGLMITFLSQFVAGFVVAFVKGWQMALVLLAVIPLLGGTGATMSIFLTKYTRQAQDFSAQSGTIAEQAIQSIRTVYSFSLQNKFSQRYNEKLEQACKSGVKGSYAFGLGFGFFMFFLFGMYGLALWFGSRLVTQGHLEGPSVFVVFMAMMIGCMSFVKLPPNLSAVTSACAAAYKVYQIIDRVPEIDAGSNEGLRPSSVKGTITFEHVNFSYPTRPDVQILKDFSLQVAPGTTVAFVGPSGSGKSTIVQLLQRFYDAASGQVSLDNQNIKDLNVGWLRQQIGVVGQEPVLFNMTIRQNLLMGSNNPESTSFEDIVNACKEANCHTFISQLPQGYDTLVGEQGSMLSGGQKQRIAIARAILKNPSILLLDEATSALDTKSERLVQGALNKASKNRTTIVVAHRLSTIMNADLIVVLDHGLVVEKGTHVQLMKMNGVYAGLVSNQAINTDESSLATANVDDAEEDDLLLEEKLEVKQNQLVNNATTTFAMSDEKHLQIDERSHASIDVPVATRESMQLDGHQFQLKNKKRLEKEYKQQKSPVWRIFWHMRPEWSYLALGVFGSALSGCVFPLYAYCLSHIVSLLSVPGMDIQPSPLGGTNLYSFLFFIIAIAAFIGTGLQFGAFKLCGEKYTKRLRGQVFAAYLKQEVGYFDLEENNVGSVTTRLAVDTLNVNEMITAVWGDVVNITVSAITALSIAFAHSWALSLVTLCMSPFLIVSTAYEFFLQRGFEDSTKKANSQSSQVAGEAIREVRTVAALNKQNYFEDRYFQANAYPHKLAVKKAYLSSIGAACSKGSSLYTNAIAFFAGVHFIQKGMIDFQQMFTSMMVIMTASETIGRSSTFAAAYTKAKLSAIASFGIIDRQTSIDPDLEGFEPPSSDIQGHVELKNIKFAYPARPDTTLFDGDFSLDGKAGKVIALVGPSGCGKSTTIGMLQRWYDPLSGTVSLDDRNVKNYSLHNLRSHMALVGQEPVLFNLTIGENVRLGMANNQHITQAQVEEACKAANIHAFVSGLPQGYDTLVGEKGSQLSGGQKQRLSIARALIRKPRVLLLDEATSALDSDSEKVVQAALDSILEKSGRTTITIAHRLSTIQNADLICVVKNGRVIEQGTHWELLKLNGTYSELVHEQSLNVQY